MNNKKWKKGFQTRKFSSSIPQNHSDVHMLMKNTTNLTHGDGFWVADVGPLFTELLVPALVQGGLGTLSTKGK